MATGGGTIGMTRAAQYAIRAMTYLAANARGTLVPVHEIADREQIPFHFLAKLAGRLARAGLVQTFKGPSGGLRLAQPAARIRLLQIIEAIDGPEFMQGCFLGLPVCDATNPCVMHDSWTAARTRMREEFAQISLADLSARLPAVKSSIS